MKHLKLFEEFDKAGYESHWLKFRSFLKEKDFELYDGMSDLYDEFIDIANDDDLSADEKSEKVCQFLEDKWGLYDGYQETFEFLDALFMDEI
jgi:hypothetical protein